MCYKSQMSNQWFSGAAITASRALHIATKTFSLKIKIVILFLRTEMIFYEMFQLKFLLDLLLKFQWIWIDVQF